MTNSTDIIVEKIEQGSIGKIHLNRPAVYNALTREAKLEIISAIRQLSKDKNIRTIILSAEGKAFCTGQDLNDRTVKAGDAPIDLGRTLETEWNPLIMSIRDCPVPVIAAISGVCAGAGLSVALACDLLFAAPAVKFISGFSKLGLCPDAGSNYILTRHLGYQRTLAFFYFNEALLSEDLEKVGLIYKISENPYDQALEHAKKLALLAPTSIELIKKNALQALDLNFQESLQRETAAQRFLGNSEDYKEGLTAFFEKRPPAFSKQGKNIQ
jgi:2-(1,2-epoxy-1,2-dihydrophenyl)acetyl-CoA isomerase